MEFFGAKCVLRLCSCLLERFFYFLLCLCGKLMCLQCWSVLEVLWSLWRVMFLRREQETEMERREEERVVLIGLCTAPSMRVISFFFSACPASFSLSSHRSTLHFSVCHSVFLCRAFFFACLSFVFSLFGLVSLIHIILSNHVWLCDFFIICCLAHTASF